jgi:hypothetical protein
MDDDEWTRHYDEPIQSWCVVNKSAGEVKYLDSDSFVSTPETSPSPPPPDEQRKVSIIRSAGRNPVFKHWVIFIAPHPLYTGRGTVLNIEGRRTHYSYLERQENPQEKFSYVDEYNVGYIDTERLEEVKAFAKNKKLKNEDQYWGCQDWTWELVKELEEEGLLSIVDEFSEERQIVESLKGAGK